MAKVDDKREHYFLKMIKESYNFSDEQAKQFLAEYQIKSRKIRNKLRKSIITTYFNKKIRDSLKKIGLKEKEIESELEKILKQAEKIENEIIKKREKDLSKEEKKFLKKREKDYIKKLKKKKEVDYVKKDKTKRFILVNSKKKHYFDTKLNIIVSYHSVLVFKGKRKGNYPPNKPIGVVG